jgi:hypothetical protein
MEKETVRISPAANADEASAPAKIKGFPDMHRRWAYWGLLIVSIAAWIGIIWLFMVWWR